MTLIQAMTQGLVEVGCPPERIEFMTRQFAERIPATTLNRELTLAEAADIIAQTKRGWGDAHKHPQN